MLELLMIALASIGIAMVVVWLYRKLTESRGVTASLVSLSENRGAMRLSAQQGFVRLHADHTIGKTGTRFGRSVRTPKSWPRSHPSKSSKKNVRKPWGW